MGVIYLANGGNEADSFVTGNERELGNEFTLVDMLDAN